MSRTRITRSVATLALALTLAACQAPMRGILVVWEDLPATTSPPGSAALVLYGQGGWVRDLREVELAPGAQVLRFPGVSPRATEAGLWLEIPASVSARRLRHDLSGRDHLLERYHERTVRIEDASGSREAVLLWTPQGAMYRIGDRLYPEAPGKVSLPPLLDLATVPTFEWQLQATDAWSGTATATYPVDGLGWHSEYTLVTDTAQAAGSWRHEAAVWNQAGIPFREVQVTLVTGPSRRESPPMPMFAGGGRAYAVGSDEAVAQRFAGRYAYPLPRLLSLDRDEAQRLSLAQPVAVSLERSFRFEEGVSLFPYQDETPRQAQLRLRMVNTAPGGPGVPLPAGKVTVFTPDPQGQLALAGEARISDTPVDQAVVLELGEAFDLTMRRVQTRYVTTETARELGYELILRNRMATPTTVEVREHMSGDWTLLRSSHPATRESVNILRFNPTLPASGEVRLTYEVRVLKERR